MKDGDDLDVPTGDGFREDPEEPDATWVTWDMAQSWSQQIHYLHGALHLFDAGDRLKKLTWIRTGISLVEQIREQLAKPSVAPQPPAPAPRTTKAPHQRGLCS